jgi:AhpC/TSA family protein
VASALSLHAVGTLDVQAKTPDPFASPAPATVLLFVRTDCPITNRYAPELQRIAAEFERRGAAFWLVYPDPSETPAGIETHVLQYKFPGTPLRDPRHELVKRAQALVSPQAAVFNRAGSLVYTGRIDDRYIDFGKSHPTARTHDLEAAIEATLDGKPVAEAKTHAVGCYLADVQ